MKQQFKRPLAMLLTVVMLLGLLPTAAFAVEGDPGEPATAVAPEVIKLGSTECEVGDEVTLNGSTTVSDGGMLSYQWYKSGDDSVDDADAAEDEKNGTPLDGETETTLTVNTSEVGTFYYYVVATNTVTLEDGETDTASTTSNVATVTVNEAEPVPPSENSEPENEQGASAGNGGLEPNSPDNNNPTVHTDGSAFDALILKDFVDFEDETGTSIDVNLLQQQKPVNWNGFQSYTLNITVNLGSANESKQLTMTLPTGMLFRSDIESFKAFDGVKDAYFEQDTAIYGHQHTSGKVTIAFQETGFTKVTIPVILQPDMAFFDPAKATSGYTLEDAIQLTCTVGDETESCEIDVHVCTPISQTGNEVQSLANGTMAQGSTSTLPEGGYIQFPRLSGSVNGTITYQNAVFESYSLRVSVPKGLSITGTTWDQCQKDESVSPEDGSTVYTITKEHFTGTGTGLNLTVSAADDASLGIHNITVLSSEYQLYGSNESVTKDFSAPGNVIARITIVSKNDVLIEIQPGKFNTYDGYSVSDYFTPIAAYALKNNTPANDDEQGVNTDELTLVVEFNTTDFFIEGVDIPGKLAPAKVVLTMSDNTIVELSGDILDTVFRESSNYGHRLLLQDITSYTGAGCIQKVEATLPGFAKGFIIPRTSTSATPSSWVLGRMIGSFGERASVQIGTVKILDSSIEKELATGVMDGVKYDVHSIGQSSVSITLYDTSETVTNSFQAGSNVVAKGTFSIPSTAISSSDLCFMDDPVVYIMQPAGFQLNPGNVVFTDQDGKRVNASWEDVTDDAKDLPSGALLYRFTFYDPPVIGCYDANYNAHSLDFEFSYQIFATAETKEHDCRDLVFLASESEFTGTFARLDIYGVNGGRAILCSRSTPFTVTTPIQLAVSSAIQMDGSDQWQNYTGDESSLAVFKTGSTGHMRVIVYNALGTDVSDAVIYIPIPKESVDLGDNFGEPGQFDMFISGIVDTSSANGWVAKYGTVNTAPENSETEPSPEDGWKDSPDKDTNMIQLTLGSGYSMPDQSSVEFQFDLVATSETGKTDKVNLFKSWYQYKSSTADYSDPSTECNFGALLQNGILKGTVYADTNRNGQKDAEEPGISGVAINIWDERERFYTTVTDETGAYQFTDLPGTQELTLTIVNPKSPDPNNSFGSYRFHAENVSQGETIGSDVAPDEDNASASKSDFTLTDGTATVNAGLIEPYTVTFLVSGGDDTTSFVNPSSRKIYAGQKLSEVTERVTVSLAPGLTFENKWTMLPSGGESSEVKHNNLLDQTVTADTTFTAITSSVSNTVTAMWWDTKTNSIIQQFELTVDWNNPVGSDFPENEAVNNRPGYNFIGWSVNGTSTIKQRDEIINASVTGAVNYIAQYEEKTDITVTLNANGGTFEGEQAEVIKTGQKYNTAVNYDTPTREGYTFLGWATTSTATVGSMSLTCPATDTMFFAVWEPGTVRLTLLENGGTWAENSSFKNGYIDGIVGEAVTLPGESDITREGHEFKGWYVQGDTDQAILTDYKFPTKATTLIAKWVPKQESITFNYGEASQIKSETVSGPHGSTVGYEIGQQLTKDKIYSGYTLTGWTAQDGTVVPAANTGSIVIEDGAIYTAIWAQNQTELIFDAGSGANFPNNGQTKTYYGSAGETLAPGDLIDPVITGKTFEGWYTEATGGSKVETFTFPNSGSITYYAHWKDAEYTVTFNYNGGKVGDDTSSTVTVIHGQSVTNVPVPELSGSTLESWQNLTTGQTMSVDEIKKAAVTADVIYNAVWSGNSYTVTFSNYDGDPNSVATVTVTESAAPVAPVVKAPEGQVFLHWKDNASENIYTAEALTKLQVKADMNFTAVFGEDSYTITFITSNGSFADRDGATQTTITKKGGQVLAENDFPTVTGSTANFTGWYYNGTTKSAEEWAGTPVSGNMTFVAAFEGKVTVSFNTMGGKWTDDGQQQYANGIEGNAGETMTLPTAEHITRTGYTFTGWYTNMDCTDKAPNVFPGSRTTYYAGWSTEGLSVTVTETPTYDGTPKTPSLTVKVGDTELTAGEDYVATYTDNVNVGTATVNVIGNGEYAGLTGTATFTINKAEQTVTFAKPGEQTATYGETFANTATAKLDSTAAKITYSSNDPSVATVDGNGTVTILKSGTVTITATAAGTSNVNEGKAEYTLNISKATPTLTFANTTVSVKATGSVSNTLTTEPKGLIVTYSSNNEDVATVNSSTGEITLVGEGTATIKATFEGNDCYNNAEDSYILTVDNDAIVYTAEGWYGTYDTQEHSITVTPTVPETVAKVTYSTTKDGTYTTDAPTYTDAGTNTVYFKIKAQGYDTVTGSAEVVISQAMLTDATVANSEYTGQPVEGTVSEVKAGTLTVPADSYDVSYVSNVNAGTAVAIITAKAGSNFVGTVPETFTITPKSLTAQMVSPIADQPYTGNKITPAVTVEDDSTPLAAGKDFTVTYGDNNTVGTNAGTVTIKGTGNYAGEVKVNFNITNTGAFKVIVDNSEHTYNGSAHTPSVVVYAVDKDGVMTPLTANIDYEVAYEDNTNAGTASVTITGKGAYTERGKSWKDTTAYFTIQPAEQSVTFATAKVEKTYGDPAFTQAATVTLNPNVSDQTPGAVTYTRSNPAVATVDSDGKVTIVGAGTATITASAAATQNYKGAEASYTLTVKPKDINSEDVTASKIPDQPYGGIPVTPDFSLTDSDSDISKHDLEVNVDYTFTYSNNDGEGTGKIIITGKGNYTGTKEVTFQIIPWSDSQVVVTPAPITIYMGGADGYEHVIVDEDTGEIKASSSLPEPGFLFDLPDMLEEALEANGKTITAVKFYELVSGKEWTVAPYVEGSSTVYRLVPGAGQEPVRVQFINAQGETVTEDQFDVGRNVNQELTMTLYKGKVGVINAIYDGVRYPIQLGESTLTVRGVTDEAQYATVTGDATAPVEGKPAVTAESGTSYTINGSDVSVENTSGVALLFDSIIDASGENRTGLLEDKAEDTMAALNKEPASGNRFAYSFQYLDLVDTNNGNAWVKASEDVTIYWPYPAGTNQDTEFTLLHFEGLHREMDTSEIGDQIANCTVSEVTIVDKTDTHIVLKVGSAGFSPFALVWEEKIPTYTITATAGTGGSITPDGVTTVQEGGSQSYTIKADNGYHISDVKVNGASVGAVESYTFTNVRSNQTIAVTFSRNSSGGGGGGGGHTKPSDPDEDIPDEPGPADPFDTGVGIWLNTEDHTAYLGGYGGGLFGPDDNMTRGQAAQMFYNLLLDKDVPITVSFTDVAPDAWYATAVNTLASLGIVTGYGNGKFGPDDSITRAQFTTIAMRFANLDTSGENIFTDVSEDDWFYEFVVGAIKYGWIGGYPDGRFGPNDTITRAQVTTIVNRMLGRSADEDYVERNIEALTRFTDVPDTHWAYYNIMEATNAHDYDRVSGGEDWTRLHK